MDRGVRAIVSHRLPNAEELNAGCSDWLECCQAYIHAKGCVADSARRAADEIDALLVPLRDYDKSPGIDAIAAIISKHFAAAPADNDAESLLQHVAYSGVEFDDNRMGYVVVQIDRDVWEQLQVHKGKR